MHYSITVAWVTRPECQRHEGRSQVGPKRRQLEVNFYILNSNSVVHIFLLHLCEQVDPLTSGAIPPLLIIMLQFGTIAHGEPMEHKGDIILEENPIEISPQYIEVMTSPV